MLYDNIVFHGSMSPGKLKIPAGAGAFFFEKFLTFHEAKCYKYQVKNLKQI